jgi:hypothetical protein
MQGNRSYLVLFATTAWLLICPAVLAVTSIASESKNSDSAAATDHRQMGRRIDELLAAEWKAAGVAPAPTSSDGEFLRRAYLDLTGVIPRVSEVREFLADERADKRELLVAQLLASPRYATHMATTWRNRILPLGVDPERSREAVGLQKWLRTRFAKNLRYDNLVGELLLAIGGDELGPALYFQANDLSPEKLAGSSAELFLGLKLECAQCHDHPFADWSQRDFWGLAAFFARVKAADERMMMMRTSYRLVDADKGDVRLPESNEIVPPKYPRGDAASDEARKSRRTQLALWMTSRDNQYFSRAAINWAWTHMFGRGLVDSLDNIDPAQSTAQTKLLDELSTYFVESGFDLRNLWHTLASSQAYQLSSQHNNPEAAAPQLFARMLSKSLTPEQLYDSLIVLAPPASTGGMAYGSTASPASMLDEDPARTEFVRRMRPPPGSVTEYRAGTLQALMLMNGRTTTETTGHDSSSLLGALDSPFMTGEEQVESLFLAALARRPDSEEREACAQALAKCAGTEDRHRAMSDLLWALVNSTEFAFNH